MSFPKDFLWGASSSSAQVEGAYDVDGKGLTTWDYDKKHINSGCCSFRYASLAVDKTHLQNINTSVMIFSKKKDICDLILQDIHRGVTYWKGIGGYTESDTYVIYTVLSKYEVRTLQEKLRAIDPEAFVVITEQDQILGNYEVRL